MRITDPDVLGAAIRPIFDVDAKEWLSGKGNIAFYNTEGDVAAFENKGFGLYEGHYFFNSRGRQAIEAAKSFLAEAFTIAKVVVGLVPVDRKDVGWITRQIGFKNTGTVERITGEHHLYVLTKEKWKQNV